MKANDIVNDARMLHLRELKASLSESKKRLQKAESDRDLLLAHFSLALAAIYDFRNLPDGGQLRIIDGWNAILKEKNVAKLSKDDVSRLKKEYLGRYGISIPSTEDAALPPVARWIVFDGKDANSYRSADCRITYTGGSGAHRADRMILDFVNAAKILGLDVSRIIVETADRDLSKKLKAIGVKVQ
ncbi:MAG: hypothetical protein J6R18_10375 [Kiritimatiellae bacterium]|nr:hypothetical protein [Kiritimatiellia bacterium]